MKEVQVQVQVQIFEEYEENWFFFYTREKKRKSRVRESCFWSNARCLTKALMMCLSDLRDPGENRIAIEDIERYIEPDVFIELTQSRDISQEAREAAINFLLSMGWKPDEKDPSQWGDFSRQYSYAKGYALDVIAHALGPLDEAIRMGWIPGKP